MDAEHRGHQLPLLVLIPVVVWALSGLTYAALAAARERARRKWCISVLKNVFGYTNHLYAGDHEGRYPVTPEALWSEGYLTDGECFLCRSASKAIEVTQDKSTPGMAFDTHTDYVYVSGLRSADPPDYILAFDDEWNHDGYGVHVVHIGGQVDWRGIAALHRELDRQEKELAALGREMKLIRPAWSAWPDPSITGHPLAGPRPWYRRRYGSAILVSASVALVSALVILAVVILRQRRQGAGNAA